jgi:hypothetical protein
LARKEFLFSLAQQMKTHKIGFILIQIDEAHSTAWPIGLEKTPLPQSSYEDRMQRAQSFSNQIPSDSFQLYIDGWDNQFAEKFRAWPDKYYCINNQYQVIAKSEYGDALIKKECTDLILELIKNNAN